MWKRAALLGLLFAAPMWAGEIGYVNGQSCIATGGDTFNCVPTAGRGTLMIEAANSAFSDLRDVFTPNWTGSGTFTCTPCMVNKGYDVCVAAGAGEEANEADTTREELALSKLACILRSHVVQKKKQDALDAATWEENPDVG